MHHKRKRPKNRRSGCLLYKNWKINGAGKTSKEYERPADRRRRLGYEQDLRESPDGVSSEYQSDRGSNRADA